MEHVDYPHGLHYPSRAVYRFNVTTPLPQYIFRKRLKAVAQPKKDFVSGARLSWRTIRRSLMPRLCDKLTLKGTSMTSSYTLVSNKPGFPSLSSFPATTPLRDCFNLDSMTVNFLRCKFNWLNVFDSSLLCQRTAVDVDKDGQSLSQGSSGLGRG